LLDEGLVGTSYGIAFRMRPGDGQGPDAYLNRQPYFQKMPRFLVHETGVHFVDVFRFLMGEVTTVWSDLRRLNPVISGEDAGVIVFAFSDGARGVFDANRLADHAAENRRLTMGEMLLEGSKATIRLDGEGRIFVRSHDSNDERAHDYAWTNTGFAGDSVYRLQAHVLAHLAAHGPLHNSARDYLTNLGIVDAIYRSSQDGRRIDVST
jgi:predicted dehydrogenase